ncbi:hypothetical protein ANAPH2_01424 [Anaplasma phagocytophilum]|nr:hypothetical protein ANAPH2_01424 [Anaplasma phagocytophilum]
MFNGAGSAPDFSKMANSLAVSKSNLPVISPFPPRMGSRITGAVRTTLSKTAANGLPACCLVMSANFLVAALSNLKYTTALPTLLSPALASTRESPLISTRFITGKAFPDASYNRRVVKGLISARFLTSSSR